MKDGNGLLSCDSLDVSEKVGLSVGDMSVNPSHPDTLDLSEDFPPGFTEVATLKSPVSNVVQSDTNCPLSTHSPSSGVVPHYDINVGSPMKSSYRDILIAHLPVYTDTPSKSDSPSKIDLFSSGGPDRFRDVTIRRKRKGGRGRGTDGPHLSVDGDTFIPLSARLVAAARSSVNSVKKSGGKVGVDSAFPGALRGSPLSKVWK